MHRTFLNGPRELPRAPRNRMDKLVDIRGKMDQISGGESVRVRGAREHVDGADALRQRAGAAVEYGFQYGHSCRL
jgi:hypothetical protein